MRARNHTVAAYLIGRSRDPGGLRRTHGTAVRNPSPLSVEQLRATVGSLPASLLGSG